MAGAVFKDTLRHTWRLTMIWGLGFLAMMILVVQMAPFMKGLELVDLLQSLPPWLMAAAGITDASLLETSEGLIALGFFGKLALLFAAYPVVMGLRVTSEEETDGTMDVMLSLPLPRWRVILEKFLAYVVNIIILLALSVLGLYIGQITTAIELDMQRLATITLTIAPVMIFVLALTTFVGSLIGQRQTVLTIITIYIIFSFAMQTVGPMLDTAWMNAIESFALFSYYDIESTLRDGIVIWHVMLMLGLAAILIAVSFFTFENRDIAV